MWQPPTESIPPPNITAREPSQTEKPSTLKYCASILGLFSFGFFITPFMVITVCEPKDNITFPIIAAVLMLVSLIIAWISYRLYQASSPSTLPSPLEDGSRRQISSQNRNMVPSIMLENQFCVTSDVHGSTNDAPPPYTESLDLSELRDVHGCGHINEGLSYLPSYDEAIMAQSVHQEGTS